MLCLICFSVRLTHRVSIQKQKQTEEDNSRKLQELQAELASSSESRQKLDRQVSEFRSPSLCKNAC